MRCSSTGVNGLKPKSSNAVAMNWWLTPCMEVFTKRNGVDAFKDLVKRVRGRYHSKWVRPTNLAVQRAERLAK